MCQTKYLLLKTTVSFVSCAAPVIIIIVRQHIEHAKLQDVLTDKPPNQTYLQNQFFDSLKGISDQPVFVTCRICKVSYVFASRGQPGVEV